MQIVTDTEIKADIQKYQTKINEAAAALAGLPETAYGWAAQKELDQKRRALIGEIEHATRLYRYAEEALGGLGLLLGEGENV